MFRCDFKDISYQNGPFVKHIWVYVIFIHPQMLETILGPRPKFSMPTGEDTEEVDLHDYKQSTESTATGSDETCSDDEEEYYYRPGFGTYGPPDGCISQ